MVRWLAIGRDADNDVKTAMISDPSGTALPYGDHGAICEQMEIMELTCLIEMPEGDFRPDVIDTAADAEAPMIFIDL